MLTPIIGSQVFGTDVVLFLLLQETNTVNKVSNPNIFNKYKIYNDLQRKRCEIYWIYNTPREDMRKENTNPLYLYLLSGDEDPKSLSDKGSREMTLKSLHGGRDFPQRR